MNNTQHAYTGKGRQRPIRTSIIHGETIHFSIELHDAAAGDELTYLEMTDDVIPIKRVLPDYTAAKWHRVDGATGYLTGATAIRLVNGCSGYTKLHVRGVEGPDAGCIGLATRNNALLASINADMRVIAGLV